MATVFSVGRSYEGREQLAIKVKLLRKILVFGHFNFKRKRKQTAVTNIKRGFAS